MPLASASDFLTDVGGPVGGGAALGGVAGFVGWLLAAPYRRSRARRRGGDPGEAEAGLGLFVGVGAGIGGLAGLLLWLYDHQGVI